MSVRYLRKSSFHAGPPPDPECGSDSTANEVEHALPDVIRMVNPQFRCPSTLSKNRVVVASRRPRLRVLGIGFLFLLSTAAMQGQVSFFTPPAYACAGVQFEADFNGDGKPDLLCPNGAGGTILLGNGDGTFTTGTPVDGNPLAVADFNGDGTPDVVEQGTGTLLVLLGKGDGTFQPAISTPSGASLAVLVAGDLNGDGEADVVGIFNSSLLVFLSKGDGTFAAGVPYALPLPPNAMALFLILGDVKGSGKTDVTVITNGDNAVGQVFVFLGNGDGTLQSPRTTGGVYLPRTSPGLAVEGDFDGDGKTDLAINVAPVCNSTCHGTNNISLLLGNGDGTFQAPKAVISENGSLAAADLNGNGKLDLVVGNSSVAQIFLGNGDGTFSSASAYVVTLPLSPGGSANAISIADFNLDGKLDMAPGGAMLLGNGDGTFQGIQYGVFPAFPPVAAVVGNFVKNSAPGVAVVSTQPSVYILNNNGSGRLSLARAYGLQEPGQAVVTGDFNGDGKLDLVVIGNDPITQYWNYSVLLGNGDGSFQSPVFHPQNVLSAGDAFSATVAEFGKDHKSDIATVSGNQSLALLLGAGDGTFLAPAYLFDGAASYLVSADFNGDGKLDIAAGTSGNAVSPGTALLFGNGDGTFQAAVFPPSLNGFVAAFTSDLNGDGKADLLSANQVALGNGDGTFNLLPSLSYGVNKVADLNVDGKLDLLVIQSAANGQPEQSGVLLGNGDGTFGPLINVPPSGVLPSLSLVADMNGDLRPDIVFLWPSGLFGTPAVNGVGVLLNNTSSGFAISATALSPATVTAGSSATSTVTVTPTLGFAGTVTLSCTGMPSGAVCSFNPPSIANSSGTSILTITTTTGSAPGAYPVGVQGSAGPTANSAALSLAVQAAPKFALSLASGAPVSQTVSAGQSAKFSLVVTPVGSFTGTVNLSCGITPAPTRAPTCSLSSSSLPLTGSGAQPVTVTVGTTAPVTMGTVSRVGTASGALPLTWTLMLLGSGWLLLRNRKPRAAHAVPMMLLALASWVGCSGGTSSSHSTPGTPTGTYTATITATSGSVGQNMTVTLVVQ
jgi:hypothetical protein